MEGVGARFCRSSTRYGPTTVFTGPVRRWKKKWIHVSSNKNNNQTTAAVANGGVNGSNGSHLLLLKWRPITASQNNSSDEKDGDSNKDEVVPIEEPRKRKFKFIPIAVLEDQKYETSAQDEDEAKPMEAAGTQTLALIFVALLGFANRLNAQDSTTLVPAIITFGDSAVDVGNNDYIHTLFKANYPPYGRDFINRQPTGRFCNADTLGFTTYPPAYLSPQASGKNLLIGTNFASAAAGYDDKTAILNHAIPLSVQMQYYKEYQAKLTKVAGSQKAASILKDALYILSAGSSDFLQNYYINPYINKLYTPDQYGSYLVGIFTSFVKDLHAQGARRIGVTSLPPLGCLPAARTLFGFHESGCVSKINTDAQQFNKKMNAAATQLQKQLPGLKIAIFDIFQPLYDLVKSPSDHGFTEANRGCCGTGTVETTSLLCNPKSPGTCSNATQYVFWDSVHPSQAANQVLADSLIIQGINLIG